MQRLISFLRSRRGYARFATAFALGVLLAATMPPISAFPLALLSVPGVIWLAQAAETKRQSFGIGWAYGSGFFIAGLYWISAALFVDFASFGWVLPLSLIVGPCVLALYTYALIPLLVHRWRCAPVVHALAFITVWAAVEWLRGHLFTGFPWNLPASMWQHLPAIAQSAALCGAYGLTLLTLLWAALPALWASRAVRTCVMASFALAALWGAGRMALIPASAAPDAPLVRIVQAHIEQGSKWSEAEERKNLLLHAQLSDKSTPADIVIWPETAVTADPVLYPGIGRLIADHLPRGSLAILGSLRITNATAPRPNYHNGIYVMDSSGQILDTYDKFHLVPFGEYIPFRETLNLTPIAAGISKIGDFTAGPGPRTLTVSQRVPPFSPLICYEVIFPGNVTDKTARPAWMVNVTNDAWYGHTTGPYQHLEITRLRAIEEGLPVARAANTGISAMIDPLGQTTASLPLGARGAITTPLPAALPPTLYSRFGDSLFALMLVFFTAFIFFYRRFCGHTDVTR